MSENCCNTGVTIRKGEDGENGASILIGTGIPSSSLGSDGDVYIDDATSDVYQKVSGAWVFKLNIQGVAGAAGAAGANGSNGTNGSSILQGAGAPSAGLGVNGDSYINNTNGDIYLKSGGSWSITGNLTGPIGGTGAAGAAGAAGGDGASFLSGVGAPSAFIGDDGDTYLDISSLQIYNKSAGVWNLIGLLNITAAELPIQGDAFYYIRVGKITDQILVSNEDNGNIPKKVLLFDTQNQDLGFYDHSNSWSGSSYIARAAKTVDITVENVVISSVSGALAANTILRIQQNGVDLDTFPFSGVYPQACVKLQSLGVVLAVGDEIRVIVDFTNAVNTPAPDDYLQADKDSILTIAEVDV